MMLSVTAAARAAGVSRTTLYGKINSGELSRTKEGIDTAELLRVFGELKKSEAPDPATEKSAGEGEGMSTWLRDQLDEANRELKQTRNELLEASADLADTLKRLAERREAAMQLEHRESRMLLEHSEEIMLLKEQSAKLVEEKTAESERQAAKALNELRALESLGWFARLLNRVPETKSGD